MRKFFAVALCAVLLSSAVGCMGMEVASGKDIPRMGTYKVVFDTTLDVIKQHAVIIGYRYSAEAFSEGAGLIVATLPQSMKYSSKTRTMVYAYLTPVSSEYTDVQIIVRDDIDVSEPSFITPGPDLAQWEPVARNHDAEVLLRNKIDRALMGKDLARLKPLGKIPYKTKPGSKMTFEIKRSALSKQLAATVKDVAFEDVPFKAAVDKLREIGGMNIYVSGMAEEATKSKRVTLKLKGLSFNHVLSLFVKKIDNLIWTKKNGVVYIDYLRPMENTLRLHPSKIRIIRQ